MASHLIGFCCKYERLSFHLIRSFFPLNAPCCSLVSNAHPPLSSPQSSSFAPLFPTRSFFSTLETPPKAVSEKQAAKKQREQAEGTLAAEAANVQHLIEPEEAEPETEEAEQEGKEDNGSESVFDISAGDVSDCPPGLQQFVFSLPHPCSYSADPEELNIEQIKDVVNTLLGRNSYNKGAATRAAATAAAKEATTTAGAGAAGRRPGVYSEPSRWCSESGPQKRDQDEFDDNLLLQYPEPNVLWPNPLLHNHRLQPFTCDVQAAADAEEEAAGGAKADAAAAGGAAAYTQDLNALQLRVNRLRLEELWKYSGVYGLSWDELDEVYIQFRRQQHQRQQQWDLRKQQILEYAAVVCKRRLRAKRKEYLKEVGVEISDLEEETREQILVPRSLFRRMTRRLYYKWHDAYFSPWRPGGLQSVLKAFITIRMLQRETNERFLHLNDCRFSSFDAFGHKETDKDKRTNNATRNTTNTVAKDTEESITEDRKTANQMQMEFKLQRILKRKYRRHPIGSKMTQQQQPQQRAPQTETQEGEGASLHAADSRHGADSLSAADAAPTVSAEEGVWDFTGVGRRGQGDKQMESLKQ
ncbi:Chromosome III, complete sequence, related [Eimeria brunetti]|uniref:Chromosome III, complete sequence, related n=1 Tax=Eimeria brunetti TaxID=51314 RepID=U6LBR7_9EIME|nr:Chromosome III, complete sequence, related [Eimeria brunetti]